MDLYGLNRFIVAQSNGVYEGALAEILSGSKRGHWMWFIFPQIEGLGLSLMSKKFSIKSLDEAEAYLRHSVLGPRLIGVTRALLNPEITDAATVFGMVDSVKLNSSLTLFSRIKDSDPVFNQALNKLYGSKRCQKTLRFAR